jgi:hypothetical protein
MVHCPSFAKGETRYGVSVHDGSRFSVEMDSLTGIVVWQTIFLPTQNVMENKSPTAQTDEHRTGLEDLSGSGSRKV